MGSRVLGEQLCALYAVIEYAGETPPNKRGKPWRDALVRSLKKLISSEGFWFDPVCHEALDALCALGIDAAPLAKTVACGLGYTLTNQKVALALVSMGPAGHRVHFEGFFACKALRGPWSDASWRSKAPAFELAPFMPMTLAPDLARVAREKSGKRVYALSALGHLIHQAVTEEDLQVVSELPPRVVAAARRHHSASTG